MFDQIRFRFEKEGQLPVVNWEKSEIIKSYLVGQMIANIRVILLGLMDMGKKSSYSDL